MTVMSMDGRLVRARMRWLKARLRLRLRYGKVGGYCRNISGGFTGAQGSSRLQRREERPITHLPGGGFKPIAV